jgi:glycosyltransferase involved in cell wall biosynthesis
MMQFVGPLKEHGIELTVRPFIDGWRFGSMYSAGGVVGKAAGLVRPLFDRTLGLAEASSFDVLFVQREAMFFGPAVFERLYRWAGGLPLVLDLDDATYLPYVSPSYGRTGSFLKFFSKTNSLIKQADRVICGNRFIAEHVHSLGSKATVIPTIVDTDVYCPSESSNEIPVLGWIGTHSTYPFLRSIFPVLEDLARKHRFRLRIVGAQAGEIGLRGIEVENLEWDLDREPVDFSTIDIGLYPITVTGSAKDNWLKGKSGFKAIQYLAVGVPFVMSPVGVCAELGVEGRTHFNAVTPEDWYNSLDKLLSDACLRHNIGGEGRRYSLQNFTLPEQAKVLAGVLGSAAG